jgi:RNA polymerase sigma-70 factor (ECF subfamily)
VAAAPPTLIDDASLVVAVQAGDHEAYGLLFSRHYESVRRACVRRLANGVEADEVVQAAFVRAYERIDQCGGERRFGAWVHVIAARMCIDVVRRRSRTTPAEDPLEGRLAPTTDGLPEEEILAAERRRQVRVALSALSSRQRDVVIARDLEGRRPPEIAASLGMTLSAVDSLLLRGRRHLASTLLSLVSSG